MNETFVPLFAPIVHSTIWEEAPITRLVFIAMLALKDRTHVFRCKTVEAAARAANLPVEEVRDAIKVLESPDQRNLDQPHEGRRIIRMEEGWLIVNGAKYQEKMQEIFRRAYKARWAKENRRSKKGKPLPGEEMYRKVHKNNGQQAADALQDQQQTAELNGDQSEPFPDEHRDPL